MPEEDDKPSSENKQKTKKYKRQMSPATYNKFRQAGKMGAAIRWGPESLTTKRVRGSSTHLLLPETRNLLSLAGQRGAAIRWQNQIKQP